MRFSNTVKYLYILTFFKLLIAQNTLGVLINDGNKAYNGYTLFAPATSTMTYLIDINGNLVKQWESEYMPGLSAYLLGDGNILRAAAVKDPTGVDTRTGGFEKFDWEGNLIWQYYYGTQHHDVEPMPNGNVLMVVNDLKSRNAAIQAGRDPSLLAGNNLRSLAILEVSQTGSETGEIVWQWNAWDHLIQDFDGTKDNFGTVADHPELIDINYVMDGDPNWLHTNSVSYDEEFDQILVSNRRTHEIWIIDHSNTTEEAATHEGGNSGKGGDLLYRWGNPIAYRAGTENDQKLFGQHDAYRVKQGIPGYGNIIVFNNGWPDRLFSSVEEFTPPVDNNGIYNWTPGTAFTPTSTVWTYTETIQTDFNSDRYGGSQRLSNGNTLICNSAEGLLFEVTDENSVVWKYANPVSSDGILTQGETPEKFSLFKCYKYGPDYPGLAGKVLTAGDPLKVYNNSNVITNFELFDNFPNPFNPSTKIEFSLTEGSDVNLTIYDLLGNKICTLLNDYMEPGVKEITWNALDDIGNPVGSGLYFYTVIAGQEKQTKKMILLR